MGKKKYFRSYDELVFGVYEDCKQAFHETAEQLRDDVKSLIDVYIYSKPEMPSYERTFEMEEDDMVQLNINGLNASINFSELPIETVDNPHHHILEEGGTMDDLVNLATGERLEDIKDYVYKNLPKIYRSKMNNR